MSSVLERIEVAVTFDERRGYVASHPELPAITALSLRVLRHRLHERLIGEDVEVRLVLDRAARLERDRRSTKPTTHSASVSS
jgi:hypothetical protein